jgi:small nuclear ribonucleoprotein (snRNP)-like protein
MDRDEARQYLTSLLNKNLRITVTDGRIFLGGFKCTDPVRPILSCLSYPTDKSYQDENVVLSNAYEYRHPSEHKIKAAAARAGGKNVKLDMTSRYLGLVVLPGHHIVKIELEQFASQMRGRPSLIKKTTEVTTFSSDDV